MRFYFAKETPRYEAAFGLSDSNVVVFYPKVRSVKKIELAENLNLDAALIQSIGTIFDSLDNCADKVDLMANLIGNGLDCTMPIERVKVHVNDCAWIMPKFKKMIHHRQNAFTSCDTVHFRFVI